MRNKKYEIGHTKHQKSGSVCLSNKKVVFVVVPWPSKRCLHVWAKLPENNSSFMSNPVKNWGNLLT